MPKLDGLRFATVFLGEEDVDLLASALSGPGSHCRDLTLISCSDTMVEDYVDALIPCPQGSRATLQRLCLSQAYLLPKKR